MRERGRERESEREREREREREGAKNKGRMRRAESGHRHILSVSFVALLIKKKGLRYKLLFSLRI